ncbi:MAG: CPBP family intramembrane glutamic endopeptidase, partial [Marinilabiliaceae bacterium]
IFLLGIFMMIGYLIVGIPVVEIVPEQTPFQRFIVSLFQLVGTLLIVWVFLRNADELSFSDVGIDFKNRAGHFGIGIVLGFFVVGAGFLVLCLFNRIEVTDLKFHPLDLFYTGVVFVIVAFTEELVGRGYILRNFMLSFNKYVALLLSSVIFALMHLGNSHIDWIPMLNLFLAGGIFGLYYIFTQNLWFPMGLHFSWNFAQTLLGFNVSGNSGYSPVEIELNGHILWHGGSFGFEGSWIAVSGQILIIVLLLLYFLRKKEQVEAAGKTI